jgi:hypothetical protein
MLDLGIILLDSSIILLDPSIILLDPCIILRKTQLYKIGWQNLFMKIA